MNWFSHLLKRTDYKSLVWYESRCCAPARFAVRRPSLAQRIDLSARVRDLTLQHEFLRAGDLPNQLDASLGQQMVRKLYLEWGLGEVKGITIDGCAPTTALLIERGPEPLVEEIIAAIKAESGLTEDERKNS